MNFFQFMTILVWNKDKDGGVHRIKILKLDVARLPLDVRPSCYERTREAKLEEFFS